MIKENQIVKNISDDEPVKVTSIQKLGPMISVDFVGVNTGKAGNRMLSDEEFAALETVSREGEFNFSGDAQRFKLFTEAERISSAYQYLVGESLPPGPSLTMASLGRTPFCGGAPPQRPPVPGF